MNTNLWAISEMNTREIVLEIPGEGIFWQIENTLKISARLLGEKKILSLVSLFLINACFYLIYTFLHGNILFPFVIVCPGSLLPLME